MSKTTNKFAPEVRERAVRMVVDHERDYPSRWAVEVSIAENIGCVPQTLHEWVKKAGVDSGKRAVSPTEVADKVKPLEREVRELRQANEILHKGSAYFAQARRAATGSDTSVGAGAAGCGPQAGDRTCSPRTSRSTACARFGGR
jgi:transposase